MHQQLFDQTHNLERSVCSSPFTCVQQRTTLTYTKKFSGPFETRGFEPDELVEHATKWPHTATIHNIKHGGAPLRRKDSKADRKVMRELKKFLQRPAVAATVGGGFPFARVFVVCMYGGPHGNP